MCRVVNVNNRYGRDRVRYLKRQCLCCQCVVCSRRHPRGYLDECRRIGFRRVGDAGLHVG